MGAVVSTKPMLSKVISYASTRDEAIDKLILGLDKLGYLGLKTNRSYLMRVLNHPKFRKGEYSTHFIAENERDLVKRTPTTFDKLLYLAVCWFEKNSISLFSKVKAEKREANFAKENFEVFIQHFGTSLRLSALGETYDFSSPQENVIESGGKLYCYDTVRRPVEGDYHVSIAGVDEFVSLTEKAPSFDSFNVSAGELNSPMPGKIFKILKAPGDDVKAQEAILIMEAMKMEHTIVSHRDGKISEILFKEGDQVKEGVELCRLVEDTQ